MTPTNEQTDGNGWVLTVFTRSDDEHQRGERHVTPEFGRPHSLTLACWCFPRIEEPADAISGPLIVHEADN